MTQISLDWDRRPYQERAWNYLMAGGRHCELIWHRRAGKDEVAMRYTAVEMVRSPATYWHMLPLAAQVRKAIWKAINPHTGIRRIDEIFPPELFAKNESDMMLTCKYNGATWQCLGSDNFQGAIGSPPKGIVYSEWALANPSARGYLRPIIAENKGWQCFVTTPRGKNHAYSTFKSAQKNPMAFAEKLDIYDTGMLTMEEVKIELQEYVDTFGEAMGIALFEQEYECSFDAAIMGAIYADEFKKIDKEGRICRVEYDPKYPVHVAMDLGRTDDTAIWFFQVAGGEVRVLEYFYNSGKDPEYYCSQLLGRDVRINLINGNLKVEYGRYNDAVHRSQYNLGTIWLPHDGRAKTFATQKSAEEQFAAVFGWDKVRIVPSLSLEDGIQASRMVMRKAWIDESCDNGIEALRSYHRKWDDNQRRFRDNPEHDWASHPSDAWRYMSIAAQDDKLVHMEPKPVRYATDRTFSEMMALVRKRRNTDNMYA